MLAEKMAEYALIPDSLAWLSDEQIYPYLSQIIDRQIHLFYKLKEIEYLYEMNAMHYDRDIKEGRIKKDEHPKGMYT